MFAILDDVKKLVGLSTKMLRVVGYWNGKFEPST
jgi:hypothetical protein